jgi:CubicO group peptidase (beta-lactamase class C family)
MTSDNAASRRGRRLTLALAAALTCTFAAYAASAVASPGDAATTPTPQERLRELVERDVRAGAPGVIVRVDNGSGRVIEIAEQAAWSRRDHLLTAADRFRMGSNTKTMVATVVMQLVAEHRLALTDSVDTRLPGLVPDGQNITLRMLFNHTSGLFNYLNDPAVLKAFTGQDTRVWTPEEVLATAVDHPPLFAPGTQYFYSNTNYLLLGMIAEKVTGESLADLVQQRIAKPLHLRNTYLVTGADHRNNPTLAHGYEPDADRIAALLPPGTPPGTAFAGPSRPHGHVDTTNVNLSTEWAAGAMVSTTQDWARFHTALMSGRLLPPAELQQMKTTVSEGSDTPNRRYGLGLEQVVTPCGTVWGHDGQVPGYSSEAYTDSTGRRTVSVFTATIFGIADPTASAANKAVVNAAICAMLDKPVPSQ